MNLINKIIRYNQTDLRFGRISADDVTQLVLALSPADLPVPEDWHRLVRMALEAALDIGRDQTLQGIDLVDHPVQEALVALESAVDAADAAHTAAPSLGTVRTIDHTRAVWQGLQDWLEGVTR